MSSDNNDEAENFFCRTDMSGHVSAPYAYFNFGFAVFNILVVAICLVLWYKNREKPYFKMRPSSSTALIGVSLVLYSFGLPFWRYALQFPDSRLTRCGYTTFFRNAATMVQFLAVHIRFMSAYYKHKLFEIIIEIFAEGGGMTRKEAATRGEDLTEISKVFDITKRRNVQRYKKRCSPLFLMKTACLCFPLAIGYAVVTSVLMCPNFGVLQTCDEFTYNRIFGAIYTAGTIGVIGFGGMIYTLKKNRPDPFGLYRELYVNMLASFPLFIPGSIIFFFPPTKYAEDDVINIDRYLFGDICYLFFCYYFIVYHLYRGIMYDETSLKLRLSDVLDHPVGKQLFKTQAATEFSTKNVDLYYVLKQYRDNYDRTPVDQRFTLVKNIIKKYFTADGEYAANVKGSKRIELEEFIAKANVSDIRRDLFKDVEEENYLMIQDDTFSRFRLEGLFKFFIGIDREPPEDYLPANLPITEWL